MKAWIHIIFAILLVACGERPGNNNSERVTYVDGDDPKMNAAIREARKSYPYFFGRLTAGDTSEYYFGVKLRIPYGDGNGEHMWFNDLYFKGDTLMGILCNDPVNIATMKKGDTVMIDKSLLSDWEFAKDGKLIGSYTTRVLYNRMTPEEKKELIEQLGLTIE